MKTYYYSIKENDFGWSEQTQHEITCKSWNSFVNFCKSISFHYNKPVRGCETPGYDNQGHFFSTTSLSEL